MICVHSILSARQNANCSYVERFGNFLLFDLKGFNLAILAGSIGDSREQPFAEAFLLSVSHSRTKQQSFQDEELDGRNM